MNALEFKKVSLTYPNGFKALHDISFFVPRGKFVSIVGSSGAGKTTLMKTINKVNKISSGTLIVNEKNINNLKGKKLRNFRRSIGLIFQNYNLVLTDSSLKNVLTSITPSLPWYRRFIPLYTQIEKMHALSCLDQLGLLDKAYIRTNNLSGGQKQRVALARTIVQLPSIILADEPVAALDPIMAKEIMDSFLKLNKINGYPIFANLHHVDLAIKYSDIIIGMKNGRIVYNGLSTEICLKDLKNIYGDNLNIKESEITRAIKENKEIRKKYEKK